MNKELSKRFLQFAYNITLLGKSKIKSYEGRHVYHQLFRSSTSCGANFAESMAAQSTRDFIHKRELILKELNESGFWINLIRLAQYSDNLVLQDQLENEINELTRIIAKSLITTKQNQAKRNRKV
jgi:four helix bundle protein